MAISINWETKVINVPKADLTDLGGNLYELDVDAFRLSLKAIEEATDGIIFPNTHSHNTQVTLSGVTYARTFEIINGYTIEFENAQYTVRCVGANHNIADVKVVNSVSLIIGNSAGLISVNTAGGSGATPAEIWSHGSRTLTTTGVNQIKDGLATESSVKKVIALTS